MIPTTPTGTADASEIARRMRARLAAARDAGEPAGVLHIVLDRLGRARPGDRPALFAALDALVASRIEPERSIAGATDDGRLVLVCGLERPALEDLARGLVSDARHRTVVGDGHMLRPSLSIGVAHDHDRGAPELEVLCGVAEAGLEVARSGGGNRMVHTDQYASVHARTSGVTAGLSEPPPPARPASSLPQVEVPRPPTRTAAPVETAKASDEETLISKLQEALAGNGHAPGSSRFQRALEELLREHPELDPEHARADLLQRRVRKLVAALELAEGEINRLRRTTEVETGQASIYREVQGLSPDDPLLALKRELMARIFEANEALQGARLRAERPVDRQRVEPQPPVTEETAAERAGSEPTAAERHGVD